VLLTLAWLNVILQPCAMAMAGDTAGCHHASFVHVEEGAGNNAMPGYGHPMVEHGLHDAAGHDTQPAHDHESAHQMDSDCTDCGGGLTDCANLDDINKSDRQKQFSSEPALVWLALPPRECVSPDISPPVFATSSLDPARLAGAFPPLNVLYCVYLD
jgi:hypothetical protein